MPVTSSGQKGFALVFIAGLLALFAFLGLATIGTTRLSSSASSRILSGRQATLAAGSGLEYAAARLWEDPATPADRGQAASAANRRDDWTLRLGSGGAGALAQGRPLNPSYARGDGWQDVDGDGAYSAGLDVPFPRPRMDLDRDGRFDAWSGRLRGGESPFEECFSLDVRSGAGLVCVNAGELGDPTGDHDLDGTPNTLDPDYATQIPVGAWRDPAFFGNVHLVNLLDNLGAIAGLPVQAVPYAPAPPASMPLYAPMLGDIEISDLGKRVLAGRPQGGYTSIDELLPVLGQADYDAVAPFLTIDGEIIPVPESQPNFPGAWNQPENAYQFHAPIDLNRAPVEILKACLRYLTANSSGNFVRLGRDEADAVAQAIDAARKTKPFSTWQDLLEMLHANASLFQADPFITAHNAAFAGSSDPIQAKLKEDLVTAHFNPYWRFQEAFAPRGNSFEVVRDAAGPDATSPIEIHKGGILRNHLTAGLQFPYTNPFGPPITMWAALSGIPCRATTEGTLTPSRARFRIESEGRVPFSAVRRGGTLALGRTIPLASQQDFTPLFASVPVVAGDPNPAVWPCGGGAATADSSWPATRSGVQSFPRFPWIGGDGTTPNFPVPPAKIAKRAYPRATGWLQLAARQMPLADDGTPLWLNHPDVTFALPFNEDGPPGLGNRYDPADWLDNLFDPMVRPAPAPQFTAPPSNLVNNLASPSAKLPTEGIHLSPCGARFHQPAIGMLGPVKPDGFMCDWAEPPFQNAGLSGINWIQEGTVSFWYPAESSGAGAATGEILFRYMAPGTPGQIDYLKILVCPNSQPDTIALESNDPATGGTLSTTYAYPLGTSPAMELAGTGWRCVALSLARSGQTVNATVYMDGVCVNAGSPFPASFDPNSVFPNNARTYLRLNLTRIDDIVFHRRALSAAEARTLALVPRFARQGSWTSPRLTLDPARFPDDASLVELVWDAFIPKLTGGTLDFTVTGYDAGGAAIGSDSFHWDGSGASRHPLAEIRGAASFDLRIDFATAPLLTLADGVGTPVAVLRDSPLLDAVGVRCAKRPRWSDPQ